MIEKNTGIFSLSNLSLLQQIQNTSFLNILLNNMDSEISSNNSPSFVNVSNLPPILLSYPKNLEAYNIFSGNMNSVSSLKSVANPPVKVLKNFNQKLKNTYKNSSNPLSGIVPLQKRVSSTYGWRNDPFTGKRTFHKGIDISAPRGAPIYPVKAGIVEETGFSKSYGNYVRIKHEDGTSSFYAHNEKNLVKKGEQVDITTQIAKVGSTGRSTGNHLHLEISQNGRIINPQKYFDNLHYAGKNHRIETRG
ncbi:MAG: M23 family metallopeptidase [Candidatus Hydrogenedens sp.]